MRLHKNLVLAVVRTLNQIFNDQVYADKAVEKILKSNPRWGSRDRGFIAETVYDIVRWKRLYMEIASVSEPFQKEAMLRLFAVWATLKGISLPPWDEFRLVPTRRIKGRFDELSKIRKFRESIPDWLDEMGSDALGEPLWSEELKALNQVAPVVLRTNTLKTTREDLKKVLAEEGIQTFILKDYPEALVLEQRSNVFRTKAFSSGLFEVQDASSQKVALFLEPKPGMRVIDACAGAGGKTLHLACLMENKGQIIALDIYHQKLKELKRRSRRNGAHNIETRLIESNKVIKKLHGKADRVLIDAPCSGTGVLRRNPDAKWKLSNEFVLALLDQQAEIFHRYAKMVKPGGKLVYATCSILPQENEVQVERFLKSDAGQDFELEKDLHLWASKTGYDGFYMARLHKRN
ncbi:MAG: RsmB/NOP family class I SAM-dependent RNA methyltransferase [Flavobacteriaceae bacterium]